jgi:hypothetical protein
VKVNLKQGQSGMVKEVKLGFSWTTLLCRPCADAATPKFLVEVPLDALATHPLGSCQDGP